ncbi:MAG: hypothetical protein OEL81_04355 [Nitrosopumilus sp.]|nr:hypothetical protein [Nitrosopumilus sp.]
MKDKFEEYESFYSELPENAALSEEDIEFKVKEDICLSLLNDSNFEYRTEKTLKKESSMSDEEFLKFLSLHPEVHKSNILSPEADNLYRISSFY